MPGIVGLVTRRPRKEAEAELRRMLDAASCGSANPLCNERGDVSLIFSGEEYPAADTISGLAGRGHQFDGGGPSALVHRVEDEADFPAGLNGMFHGVAIDRRRGTATLFN